MNEKQIKMQELKAMVRVWKKEKSLTTAYDICEFLANNLNLEEEWAITQTDGSISSKNTTNSQACHCHTFYCQTHKQQGLERLAHL